MTFFLKLAPQAGHPLLHLLLHNHPHSSGNCDDDDAGNVDNEDEGNVEDDDEVDLQLLLPRRLLRLSVGFPHQSDQPPSLPKILIIIIKTIMVVATSDVCDYRDGKNFMTRKVLVKRNILKKSNILKGRNILKEKNLLKEMKFKTWLLLSSSTLPLLSHQQGWGGKKYGNKSFLQLNFTFCFVVIKSHHIHLYLRLNTQFNCPILMTLEVLQMLPFLLFSR